MKRARLVVVAVLGIVATRPLVAQAPPAPILVSRQLAEAQHLAMGARIRLAADPSGSNVREFQVTGIYEPTPDPMELTDTKFKARLHLPDLLAVTAADGGPLTTETVDHINVRLRTPTDASAFSRELMSRAPGVVVQPVQRPANITGTFVTIRSFHRAIAVVTIVASTVFLLALSLMLVDERRETVGILRLIGLSSGRVMTQVFLEGLLIAIIGAFFGLALALASEVVINRYFQWHYNTALVFVRVTPLIWGECLLIAVPLGIVATLTASWVLLRRQVLSVARR
jgi:ABC-type lipoprotein release transport system permease subunit